MFQNTQPAGAPPGFEPTSILTTLTPESETADTPRAGETLGQSVLLDLQRFAADPAAAELLAVVAASVRHGTPLSLALEAQGHPLGLTLHPRRQAYYSEVDLCALGDMAFAGLRLISVRPDPDVGSLFEAPLHQGLLRPLLWHLAMRGARADLLPEISGPVRCRVTLGASLNGLPMGGLARRLIQQMKRAPVSLDELSTESAMARASIQRLWNALYLQSALMVSRTFPH